MRAAFYIGLISAIVAPAIQAIELKASCSLMAPDSHLVDSLSLAQVGTQATFLTNTEENKSDIEALFTVTNKINKLIGGD